MLCVLMYVYIILIYLHDELKKCSNFQPFWIYLGNCNQ